MMPCVEPFQVRAACDMDLTDEELDQFLSTCIEQEGRVLQARGPVFDLRGSHIPPRSQSTSASNSAASGSVSAGLVPQPPSELESNWQQFQGSNAVQKSAGTLSTQQGLEGAVNSPIAADMASRPCHSHGPSWTHLQHRSSFSAGEATAVSTGYMGTPAGGEQPACNAHSSFTESPAGGVPQVCWEPADHLLASRGSNTWNPTSASFTPCIASSSPEGTVPCPNNGSITAPGAHSGPLTEPAAVLQQQLESWQLLQTAESGTWPPAASIGTAATPVVPTVSAAQSSHGATPAGTPASSPIGGAAQMSAMALPSVESVLAAARLPSGKIVNAYPGAGTAVAPAVTLPAAASIPTADSNFSKQPRHTSPRADIGTRKVTDCSRNPKQLQRFEDLVMQMFLQQRASIEKSQEQGQPHQLDSQRSIHHQQWQGSDSHQISDGTVMPEAFCAVAGQGDLVPGAIEQPPTSAASGSVAPSATLIHKQCSNSAGDSPKSDTTARRIFAINTSPSKLQPSHGTVEKQRRDRLNSLIDELATLVPPSDPRYEKSVNSRRPKHIVLADAINLVRAMQLKLQMDQGTESAVPDLSTAGAVAGLSVAGYLAPHTNGNALVLEGTTVAEVPDTNFLSGVTIEYSSYGSLVVKVGCRDHSGLLSDVLNTLKAVPVAIVGANATIGDDGMARAAFEVRTQDMTITPDHIHQLVHNTVFPDGTPRTKRLRQTRMAVRQHN